MLTCHNERHQARSPGIDPTGQFPKKQRDSPISEASSHNRLLDSTVTVKGPS